MQSKKTQRPILFATLGFPGSGKTFFSRRFAKEMKLPHLNSDKLRSEMFPNPSHSQAENAIVFQTMDFIAGELLRQGVSVIYDANSTRKIYRKRLQSIAKKNKADYVLLWFRTPVELALKRVEKRSNLKSKLLKQYHRPIDSSVLYRIKDEEEEPQTENHIILQGRMSYRTQKELVENYFANNR